MGIASGIRGGGTELTSFFEFEGGDHVERVGAIETWRVPVTEWRKILSPGIGVADPTPCSSS